MPPPPSVSSSSPNAPAVVRIAVRPGHRGAEDHHRDAVVEQALAVDHRQQPRRQPGIPQQPADRDRDRSAPAAPPAPGTTAAAPPAEDHPDAEAVQHRRHQHAQRGERQYRPFLARSAVHIDMQAAGEQHERQQPVEEHMRQVVGADQRRPTSPAVPRWCNARSTRMMTIDSSSEPAISAIVCGRLQIAVVHNTQNRRQQQHGDKIESGRNRGDGSTARPNTLRHASAYRLYAAAARIPQTGLPDKGRKPMEVRLDGRTAIITGSSKGLGLAMAKEFAASGANVAILARGPTRWPRRRRSPRPAPPARSPHFSATSPRPPISKRRSRT